MITVQNVVLSIYQYSMSMWRCMFISLLSPTFNLKMAVCGINLQNKYDVLGWIPEDPNLSALWFSFRFVSFYVLTSWPFLRLASNRCVLGCHLGRLPRQALINIKLTFIPSTFVSIIVFQTRIFSLLKVLMMLALHLCKIYQLYIINFMC